MMNAWKYFVTIMMVFTAISSSMAQYREPEEKDKVDISYPQTAFDSLAAKSMLARGTGTIKGIAYTKAKNNMGFKAGQRIYANKMKVVLLPVTPYFEAWYKLRKEKENLKKRRYVHMSNEAYKYRLEAISNSDGKFTFPEMKPGKYFLQGFLEYTYNGSYNEYTGSGYNSYGGRTNYYQQKHYTLNYEDRIEEFVEIKSDGEIVKVKLH
jgi:hypothetical protein